MALKELTMSLLRMKKVPVLNQKTGLVEEMYVPLSMLEKADQVKVVFVEKEEEVKPRRNAGRGGGASSTTTKKVGKAVDEDDYLQVARYLKKLGQSTVYRKNVKGVLHVFRSCSKDVRSFDFWTEMARGGEDKDGNGTRRMPVCQNCLRRMEK